VEKTSISQKLLEMALFEPNRESVTRVHPEHKTFSSPIPPTGVLPLDSVRGGTFVRQTPWNCCLVESRIRHCTFLQ